MRGKFLLILNQTSLKRGRRANLYLTLHEEKSLRQEILKFYSDNSSFQKRINSVPIIMGLVFTKLFMITYFSQDAISQTN